jgi:5'-3' exonuclease
MNNIIFDGNYLFYKTLFVLSGYGGKKGSRALDTKQEQEIFIRKVATDMSHAIRQFGSPDRIIFAIDSKSWRKEIQIEENEGYKAHRKQDDTINWDNFYGCMNEFARVLENQGIIVSRIERAEGDDLMYLWSRYLLKQGQNSIIVTGDKDSHQLIRLRDNNFVVIYNPNSKTRKIYTDKGFKKWLHEEKIDLFDASSFMGRSQDLIHNALEKTDMEEINPVTSIFRKVISGDGGDGVPSIFNWKTTTKSGEIKNNRITEGRADKIIEYVTEKNGKFTLFQLPEFTDDIAVAIEKITKQKVDSIKLKEKIERNLKLVVLSHKVIPTDIMENFLTHYKEKITLPTLVGKKYDISVLLEGSRFLKDPGSFQSDIFSGLNKLI